MPAPQVACIEILEDRTLLSGGALDPTFGTDGKVVTDFVRPALTEDRAHDAVVTQPDGKIVVAGHSRGEGSVHFTVIRYNLDGSLDTTFGDAGIVRTNFGVERDVANNIALDSQGRIIVVGASLQSSGWDVAIARYLSDGSLDTSFSNDGKVLTNFGGNEDIANGVAIDANDHVVIAGITSASGSGDFLVARYDTQGNLDSSFQTNGKTATDFAGGRDLAESVAIDSQGRIAVVGQSFNPETGRQSLAVARYDIHGNLDTQFDGDGRVVTESGGKAEIATAIVTAANDQIVIAGSMVWDNFDMDLMLARYDDDGSLDLTFGNGGMTTSDFGSMRERAQSLAIDANGQLIVAGQVVLDGSTGADFLVARYNGTDNPGALDQTFGLSGIVTTDFNSSIDQAHGVAVDGNKIIAVGESLHSTESFNFALARYDSLGNLDLTFDGDGLVVTDVGIRSAISESGEDITIVQPNSKILVAGTARTDNNGNVNGGFDFAIARYNSDGSLDLSFGTNGRVTTDLGSSTVERIVAIGLQSDGKIVAAGQVRFDGTRDDVALVRYHSDGTLDTSFGNNGIVIADFGGTIDHVWDLAIDSQDRIVVGGDLFDLTSRTRDVFLTRYSADGSSDPNFGTDGLVRADFGSERDESVRSIAIDGSDRILFAGRLLHDSTGQFEFLVGRYDENGTLDPTFGTNGWLLTDFGGMRNFATSITLDSIERIVVGGWARPSTTGDDFAVARYDESGNLDSSFGGDGKVTVDLAGGNDLGAAVAINSTDQVIIAGRTFVGPQTRNDFGLARFHSNGTLDLDFGSGGTVITDFNSQNDVANAIVLDADENILVAGSSHQGDFTGTDFALARYIGASNTAPVADAGGPYSVGEGGTISLDASASTDADQSNTTLTYEWDFDGDGIYGETGAAAEYGDETGMTPVFSAANLDGPTTHTVSLRVTDDGGLVDTATATIDVTNIAPTATVTGHTDGVRLQNRTLTLGADDPSTADQSADFTYEIDWNGDGLWDETASGPSGTDVSHSYAATGTYTVSIRATDKDGATSAVVTHTIDIVLSGLQDDELYPGQKLLAVGIGNGGGKVHFKPGATADEIEVVVDGVSQGVYQGVGRILGLGGSGNDDLKGNANITVTFWLFGGEGNDRLKGGANADVLVGGTGDDLLVGKAGRDFLIAGDGADRLVGNTEDDIVAAGTLLFDNEHEAIAAVMAEWTSSRDIYARWDNLTGNGTGERNNGDYFLKTSDDPNTPENEQTITVPDGLQDILTGGEGTDWFIFDDTEDRATDLTDPAFEDDMSFIEG